MTEQPPPSAEATKLATRIRDRYHAPGNEHVLELDDAALEIDRFAERVCEQRVSAERGKAADVLDRIALRMAEVGLELPANDLCKEAALWRRGYIGPMTEIRAPAERPVPPQQPVGWCCDNGNFGDGHECQKQPSPPAVVDYTREAENLAQQLIDAAQREGVDLYTQTMLWHASSLIDRQAAAPAAVASEHQAALDEARGDFAALMDEATAEIAALEGKLARLREPEMREAAIAAMIAVDGPQGWTWDEMFDAALAVITEKLT